MAERLDVRGEDPEQLPELMDAAVGGEDSRGLRMLQEERKALLRLHLPQRGCLDGRARLCKPGEIPSESREHVRLVELRNLTAGLRNRAVQEHQGCHLLAGSGEPLSHEEVIQAGREAAGRMGALLSAVLPRI